MSTETHQPSTLKFTKTSPLTPEDAANQAKTVGALLENMLEHLESMDNEKAKVAYEECRQIEEYLSAQLSTLERTDCVDTIQESLDIVTRAIVSYEMVNAAAEGDWDSVDISFPSL